MATTDRYPSVRPYLFHALAASAAVVGLPVAAVYGLMALSDPDPAMPVLALLGVFVSLGVTVVGTALWMRRPDSTFIGFSDLMLPRWLVRHRAERQLDEGARLLGLDRSGHPVDGVHISPEEQLRVLKDLTEALETKDPYTHGHSRRVERHAYRTAAAMGLPAQDLEDVRKAAALHDVGKIRVPDRILRKDGALTIDERVMIEEHAVVGAWMVSSVGNADVIAGVRHHHEHWDGTGYPDNLAGAEIPLYARIIAVADTYDALTSSRPYRPGCARAEAVEIIQAEAGRQFDPEVVEHFVTALPTRLPVAAGLFIALAGPQRLLRELFAWFRRFGAGSLSPAVGAAGAAVVLGASVFTPSLPQKAEPPSRSAVAEVAAPIVDEVEETEAASEAPERKRRTRERVVAAPAPQVEDRVLGVRFERPAAATDAVAAEPTVDEDTAAPEPRPEPEPEPEPTPDPTPEPEPSPEPEPTPAPEPSPAEDSRNPNDGEDGCPQDGDAGHGNDDC